VKILWIQTEAADKQYVLIWIFISEDLT